MTGDMNSDEPAVIHIMMVDDRASFKRSEDHPKLIFLSTVLRWAAKGNYNHEAYDHVQVRKSPSPEMLDELKRLNEAQRIAHPTFSPEQLDEIEKLSYRGHCVTAQIRSNNSSAMASVGSLLADGIELGAVPVLNTHSRLFIGRAEKEVLVSRLRRMDVNGNATGQAEIDNEDYLLGGKELYLFIVANVAPVDIDREKVGLLRHLEWEGLGNLSTLVENQAQEEEEHRAQGIGEGEPRKMKKAALIAMLESEGYKNVENTFRHSGGIGGLSEAAKHQSHGYWYVDKARAWFEQEKAKANHVKATNNPGQQGIWNELMGVTTHKMEG